jgi:hypothetical protein
MSFLIGEPVDDLFDRERDLPPEPVTLVDLVTLHKGRKTATFHNEGVNGWAVAGTNHDMEFLSREQAQAEFDRLVAEGWH